MIKAIVFDLDETLIDRRKAFLKFCDYFIDTYGEQYPYQGTRENLIQAMVEIDANGYGGLENMLPRLEKRWKLPMSTEEFIRDRNQIFGKLSVPKPYLTEILEKLRTKYKLGMITNGFSSVQREKIATVGIENYFDDIIVSGEHPFAKPDPRIFQLSCSRLMVEPDEMIYVGDYYPNDIVGALSAKIKPIWITEETEELKYQFDGIKISKLIDLLEVL